MATQAATSLGSAFVAALAEIEGAAKDKVNPAFKSKYADLGSVIDTIRPVLAKHGLAFTQHSSPSEDGVTVETFVRHVSGEKESLGSLYVPANKKDAQGFGSALTYARRHSLMTAFGVPAEDDDGSAASKSRKQANDTGEAIDDGQYATLATLIENVGANTPRLMEYLKEPGKPLSELPASKYAEAVAALQAKRKAA